LAVLMASGGIAAPLVLWGNANLLQVSTWRTGWVLIGVLNLVLAAIALAFVRDSPESIGQRPDGAAPERATPAQQSANSTPTAAATARPDPSAALDGFTTAESLRTPQFSLMIVSGLAYSVPWSVLNTHSRFHLKDLGFELEPAAAILSLMVLVSTFGRLSGALGDFLSPPRLLGVALALEGLGCGLFLIASTKALAYTAVILVGVGFGTAYISQATTFAQFFGRRAFATTTGIRFSIGAVFSAFAPGLAGWFYDERGSYALPFVGLMVLSLAGAAVALLIRAPRPPATRLATVAAQSG
jgi:cyanate permease